MIAAADVKVIAHRGASAYEPEHTFAAYDLALAMGAHMLELDLRLTADGRLAVVHDRDLFRTAGDRRSVSRLRAADLASLEGPRRPLMLEKVLERYGDATRYLIDLKVHRAPIERQVVDALAAAGLTHRAQVQTFSRSSLARVRELGPRVSLSQLYTPRPSNRGIVRDLARVASFADTVGPWGANVDPRLMDEARRLGLRVQPYTINEPVEIERLLDLGVHGLITDLPDVVAEAIERRAAADRLAAAA